MWDEMILSPFLPAPLHFQFPPLPEFVSLKSSCLFQEFFNILTLDSCDSVWLPFLVFDWASGHPGDFSQFCWFHVHCGDGWRHALCALILFTWTGVCSTSLSDVCRYTVAMAGDMHCVHLSYLLGLVSTPLLSVLLVAGTLW